MKFNKQAIENPSPIIDCSCKMDVNCELGFYGLYPACIVLPVLASCVIKYCACVGAARSWVIPSVLTSDG